jgi:cyclic pyranopterin phosphate synthase
MTPHANERPVSLRVSVTDRRSLRCTYVGFISPYSEPFCAGCRRLRLTATGVLIGCLARDGGIPLAPLLRGGRLGDHAAVTAAVERALEMKRQNGEYIQPRAMVGIGG